MKLIEPPLKKPEGHRYWAVNLKGKGNHYFKFQTYSVMARVYAASVSIAGVIYSMASTMSVAELAGRRAILVGACWNHRMWELEIGHPTLSTDLEAYGEAVLDELMDAGYDAADITMLWQGCLNEAKQRFGIVTEARDKSDFGPGAEKADPAPVSEAVQTQAEDTTDGSSS